MKKNSDVMKQAWNRWVAALRRCPRISWYKHGGVTLPVSWCKCGDCEAWRKTNKLHDEYRQAAGLPIYGSIPEIQTSHETVSVLRALIAYLNNQLPPYTCTPHGPGHKEEWISRANQLIYELKGDDKKWTLNMRNQETRSR